MENKLIKKLKRKLHGNLLKYNFPVCFNNLSGTSVTIIYSRHNKKSISKIFLQDQFYTILSHQ